MRLPIRTTEFCIARNFEVIAEQVWFFDETAPFADIDAGFSKNASYYTKTLNKTFRKIKPVSRVLNQSLVRQLTYH